MSVQLNTDTTSPSFDFREPAVKGIYHNKYLHRNFTTSGLAAVSRKLSVNRNISERSVSVKLKSLEQVEEHSIASSLMRTDT